MPSDTVEESEEEEDTIDLIVGALKSRNGPVYRVKWLNYDHTQDCETEIEDPAAL